MEHLYYIYLIDIAEHYEFASEFDGTVDELKLEIDSFLSDPTLRVTDVHMVENGTHISVLKEVM